MRALILQLDGKIPNLALLKIAAAKRAAGCEVTYRHAATAEAVEPLAWDPRWDEVFASAVFSKSRPLADRVRTLYPQAVLGGTGWDLRVRLEDAGISDATLPDYSDLPEWTASIGFTMRGCARSCDFCVVPAKEGKPASVSTVADIWRGEPWPRRLLLLDNNFFAQRAWRERSAEITDGGFEVSLTQGIDLRALTEEQAAAVARMKYRSFDFKSRRIYGAWDKAADEAKVFRGIERLIAAGVEPRAIMVYMIVGFGTDADDWVYRQAKLSAAGVLPYPMPYTRDPAVLGFCRWVTFGYWRQMTWDRWKRDGFQAHALKRRTAAAQPDLWDAVPAGLPREAAPCIQQPEEPEPLADCSRDEDDEPLHECPYCRDTGEAWDPQTGEGPRCPACKEAA